MAKSFTASASVNPMNRVSISSFNAPSCKRAANLCDSSTSFVSFLSVDTMIRLGYRLSYSALDSRRNSGLNIIFFVSYFLRTDSVYPTGIVDLMTMMASGFTFKTSSITASTAEVSK